MKKIVFLLITFLITNICFSQFVFTYDSVDSTYTNYGGWSLLKMYAQKDSTANFDSYFFKSYHRNFQFLNTQIRHNKPFSEICNIMLIDSNSGKILSTKFLPFSRVSGFNSSVVTNALGYTPYNSSNPAGYISSYTETDPLFNTKFSGKNTGDLTEGSNLYFTNSRVRNAVSLTTTGTSGAATYNSSTGVLNIPQYTGTTYSAGTGISIASNTITNIAPDQTVTLTAGTGISITGTYPNFTISTSTVNPTISVVSRTLNSNFTPSVTKASLVSYSVTCSVTNPLLVGTSSAVAYLEYSTNGGSSWLLPSQIGNSSGVGITVTVQLTNGQTGTLVGMIPVNALVRIRTATTGTASLTYVTGQEIQF